MSTVMWVMLAGGLGSGARYLVGLSLAGSTFPYATVIVNLAGSFFLGVVAQVAIAGALSPEARVVIGVGLLGGFTTYSSFNQETLSMLMSGAYGAAAINVGMTLIGGLLAGFAGMFAAQVFSR